MPTAGTQNCGGPDPKLGFAVTTGFIWNLPWIAPGDRLSAGIVYSEGAIGYAAVTPSGGATNIAYNRVNGNQFSYGGFQDGVYESVGLGSCRCAVLFGTVVAADPTDHGLEHVGCVRASVDTGSADVDLRFVHRRVEQRTRQRPDLQRGWRRLPGWSAGCDGLRHRLERLEHRFPHAVGTGQGPHHGC